jgi:hypothetical protein
MGERDEMAEPRIIFESLSPATGERAAQFELSGAAARRGLSR